jgi:collagenase-like PrtC family protease
VRNIELLAPAKDAATGIVAINCGADAVYIGAERFGARESAGNSVADIEKLVTYAHQYYARVYVTLNTILKDEELPDALRLARQLYDIGVDGLIVQDTGLFELPLPPIPLIASTQMHNNSPEKVHFLENVGFQRVILARELTLEQIRQIRRQTAIELEVFIHGALCVSYSGRCYLSYAIGGRSGNRGQCAQPCRRKYQICDISGKAITDPCHFLSLKDLNRSAFLPELLEAGVTAFKIEGRLKDAPYVANIVGFYRQALDAILNGKSFSRSSSGKTYLNFKPNPHKTFNRGYTSYGLETKEASIASIHTPKSLGESIGVVSQMGKNHFILDRPHDLTNGDGLCFFNDDRQLCGTKVNAVRDNRIYPEKMESLKKWTEIFRNYDHRFVKQLTTEPARRLIDINMVIEEGDNGFKVTARDEDSNQVEVEVEARKAIAQKPTEALETIRRQLTKLGNTPFGCEQLKIDCRKPYFLPVSLLNQLRRDICDRLMEVREANRPRSQGQIIKNNVPYPYSTLDFTENVLNEKARSFYRRHGATCKEPAAESGMDMEGRRVMTTLYCIKKELGLCGISLTERGLTEPLYLVDEDGHLLMLEFNCQNCGMAIYFG